MAGAQPQDTEQSAQKIWIPPEDLDPKCGYTGTNDHVWRLAFIWNPNLEDVFRFRNREQKRQITSTMYKLVSLHHGRSRMDGYGPLVASSAGARTSRPCSLT